MLLSLIALLCGADAVLTLPLKKTNVTEIPHYLRNHTSIAKREADPNAVLTNQGYWFSVDLQFGSSRKTVLSYLDTGSADTWIATNLWDPSESDTDTNLNEDRKTCYGSGECIEGYMVNDEVWIGDNMAKANFVVDTTSKDSERALLGLSWTNYDNFPYTLKTSGLTHSVAYSIWMNAQGKGDGSICFGGIDTSKFSGSIGVVQNRDTPSYDSDGNLINVDPPTKFSTPLNGISVKLGDSTQKVLDSSVAVWFDTGTYQTYLPRAWQEAIGAAFGCAWDDDYGSLMCGKEVEGSLIFDFSGVEIEIDAAKLIYGVWTHDGDHWDYGFMFYEQTGDIKEDTCLMFGNSWQRYVYIVYDMEHRNFGFAKALTDEEANAQSQDNAIQEIQDSIPGAYTGSNYGTTYHTNSVVSTATNFGDYTYTPTARH